MRLEGRDEARGRGGAAGLPQGFGYHIGWGQLTWPHLLGASSRARVVFLCNSEKRLGWGFRLC